MTEEERLAKEYNERKLKEELERYEAQNQEAYDKEVSGENFLKDRAKEENDDPNAGDIAKGVGFEIAAGVATDIATKPLLALPPVYALANFVSGAAANAIAQRLRGDTSFSLGEILSSGAVGVIPGTSLKAGKNLSKVVGKANTIKRAAISGGLSGVGSEALRIGIDEQRFLNAKEALLGGAVGGTASAGMKKLLDAGTAGLQNYAQHLKPRTVYAASDDAISIAGFTQQREALNDYFNRAYKHRFDRAYPGPYPLGNKPVKGAKTNLMKGFDEVITNDAGTEFILVRKKTLSNTNDIASKDNYMLKSKFDVEDEIIARSGYEVKQDEDVKFLQLIRRELNNIEQQNPSLYLSSLMEYGDSAYLEHKVARRMAKKFWRRVEANRQGDDFGKWAGATNRNTLDNLRLLFDPNYKTLKDTTEARLDKLVKRKGLPDSGEPEGFVISIEDPNQSKFSAKSLFVRSNPGNIQIRKAGNGQVVGIIPDFYRQIYSTEFATAFKKNAGSITSPTTNEKIRAQAGETIQQYRDRIIGNMLENAVEGKGVLSEEDYINELGMFYGTFAEFYRKTDTRWVRIPQWAMDIISNQTDAMDQSRFVSRKVRQANIDVDSQKELDELEELQDAIKQLPRTKTNKIDRRFAKTVKDNMKRIDELRKKFKMSKFKL